MSARVSFPAGFETAKMLGCSSTSPSYGMKYCTNVCDEAAILAGAIQAGACVGQADRAGSGCSPSAANARAKKCDPHSFTGGRCALHVP